jgi:hypothetical protein
MAGIRSQRMSNRAHEKREEGDMKRLFMSAIVFCFLIMFVDTAQAFDIRHREKQVKQEWTKEEFITTASLIPEELHSLYFNVSAQVDTYIIAHYDFEQVNWQGWTSQDNTRRILRCFWHVDDFDGLPGWDPLEGTQSMWCGTRPDAGDAYMCSWVSAPGYGNNWSQSFVSEPFSLEDGLFTLSFRGLFDSEPIYDWISIDYDEGTS